MDEKDKKEKHVKLLFELTELPEAFMGLQVLILFFGILIPGFQLFVTSSVSLQ